MDLDDELIVNLGTSIQAKTVLLQKLIEGGREIGQPPADGQIAPPAETFMIKNAHLRHVDTYACRSKVQRPTSSLNNESVPTAVFALDFGPWTLDTQYRGCSKRTAEKSSIFAERWPFTVGCSAETWQATPRGRAKWLPGGQYCGMNPWIHFISIPILPIASPAPSHPARFRGL